MQQLDRESLADIECFEMPSGIKIAPVLLLLLAIQALERRDDP